MFIGLDIEDIVRHIRDRVAYSKETDRFHIIRLNNVLFNDLYILQRRMVLLDRVTIFDAVVDAVSERQMGEEEKEAYRRLKSMECTAKFTGIFSKTAKFFSRHKGKRYFRDLKSDCRLAETLNADRKLTRLVGSLNPYEMSIILWSIDPSDALRVVSTEQLMESEASFYDNPTKISWIVRLGVPLDRTTLRLRKAILGVIDALDMTSRILLKITAVEIEGLRNA